MYTAWLRSIDPVRHRCRNIIIVTSSDLRLWRSPQTRHGQTPEKRVTEYFRRWDQQFRFTSRNRSSSISGRDSTDSWFHGTTSHRVGGFWIDKHKSSGKCSPCSLLNLSLCPRSSIGDDRSSMSGTCAILVDLLTLGHRVQLRNHACNNLLGGLLILPPSAQLNDELAVRILIRRVPVVQLLNGDQIRVQERQVFSALILITKGSVSNTDPPSHEEHTSTDCCLSSISVRMSPSSSRSSSVLRWESSCSCAAC